MLKTSCELSYTFINIKQLYNYTMEDTKTTITINKETWKRLSNRKAYPSQTFDTIINNLMEYEKAQIHYNLNEKEENKNETKK